MNQLDIIFYDGFDKLMTFNPSRELAEAMDATEEVLFASDARTAERILADLVDEFSDALYEQERANWYYHLIDPLFDEVRKDL